MKKTISLLFAMLMTIVFSTGMSAQSSQAPSAATVIDRCAAKLYNSKGIEATFSASSGQGTASGSIKIAGNRFCVSTGHSTSWYDGKDMWVLASGETTLFKPTREELVETNPLLYIKGNAASYNAIFARVQPTGKYLVVLLPKKKGGDVSRIDITIDKGTMLPEKILITSSSGQKGTVTVKSLRLDRAFHASTFVYPADKYPGVEVNDLR